MGLYIVQEIVAAHGGQITVESVEGHGNDLYHHAAADRERDTRPLWRGCMRALHGASDSGGTPPAVPSLAILLVDDEPAMVKALTALLRRDGHRVDTAANGQLALVQLQERPMT